METAEGRTGISLSGEVERWAFSSPFRIANHVFTEEVVLVVTASDGCHSGRGEAAGVIYLGETPEQMLAQVDTLARSAPADLTRARLRTLLPPGGARNAIDCALWDLEAKRSGCAAWQLAGLQSPQPILTTFTIGIDTPARMAAVATIDYADARALKLKLLGDGQDVERVRAVRHARPDAWIGVDANQSLTLASLAAAMPHLVDARVSLIEQPLPRDQDSLLAGLSSPIPIAADESVQSLADVAGLSGRFQAMNIKLDKCGGLTEALLMAQEGRRQGLSIMVGNMGGTSLATVPAMLLAQLAEIADLDGPVLLERDRQPSVSYRNGAVSSVSGIWG